MWEMKEERWQKTKDAEIKKQTRLVARSGSLARDGRLGRSGESRKTSAKTFQTVNKTMGIR